jgi:xanthine dehydrogenase accessory factor
MNRALIATVHDELSGGGRGVLCVVVEEKGSTPRSLGASMWVRPDGSIQGTVGGGAFEHHVIGKALSMLREGPDVALHREAMYCTGIEEGEAACGGELTAYCQVLGAENELFVFGAGHVGKAVAQVGAFAGFRVTVWDERPEYANPENIPWGRTVSCPAAEILEHFRFHDRAFAVIATRGHALDSTIVRALDGQTAKYIGLIGSRRKIAVVRRNLLAQGVSEAHLNRIYQPVGIPLRAETPEEIAISVTAELIAVLRGGEIRTLRSPLAEPDLEIYPRFD